MKNKGLIILTGVVAIVVGYAVYDYQSEKYSENKKSSQSVLVKLNKDQINEFQVIRTNVPNIVVQRSTEGWKIVEPISETADQGAVEDFIGATVLEKYTDLVKQGDAIDWKIFGLDQPKGTLVFKTTAGNTVKILVSSKNNFSSDPYLKIDGENKVYTGSSTWSARAEKKPFDFRDKRLMKKAEALVLNLKVIHGSDQLFIEKKEGVWSSPSKKDWKLDQTKSSEIAYMLNNTSALDIVKEGKVSLGDLKQYGLDKSLFSVELGLKDNKKWRADFGKNNKSEYFAKISEPTSTPHIMQIAIQDVEKLQSVNLNSLRDHREPFNFNKEDVKKFDLTLPEAKAEFAQHSDSWKVAHEDKTLEYKTDKVSSILSQLRNLEVADFEAPAVGKMEKLIDLIAQDGKSIFELSTGSSYKKKIDGTEKKLISVKSNLYKNVVGLDESTFKNIGLSDLVKKRPKEENKK